MTCQDYEAESEKEGSKSAWAGVVKAFWSGVYVCLRQTKYFKKLDFRWRMRQSWRGLIHRAVFIYDMAMAVLVFLVFPLFCVLGPLLLEEGERMGKAIVTTGDDDGRPGKNKSKKTPQEDLDGQEEG